MFHKKMSLNVDKKIKNALTEIQATTKTNIY